MNSKIYSMDFSADGLVPLEHPRLNRGQIVTHSDRWGSKEFAVVGQYDGAGQSQRVVCLEDGRPESISAVRGALQQGWTLADQILSEAELLHAVAAAERNGARIEAEIKRQADERSRWAVEYGYLRKPGEKLSSHACGAKNIKAELARAFPGVKFSVKSDSFSGGDSIDINWDLGPTTREVQAITGKYEEGHFNGMEDIYEYDHGNQWPEIYGGAKYVSESRGTGGAGDLVARLLCERSGLVPPADGRSWWNVASDPNNPGTRNLASEARELLFKQSYPAGAVITGIDEMADRFGGRELRVVFCLPDGTIAAAGTPAATEAKLRADYAECSGETRGEFEALAAKTGISARQLFGQYQSWDSAQCATGKFSDREISRFADTLATIAPAAESNAVATVPTVQGEITVKFNPGKNGVEIHFARKPDAATLENLKANGWRWSRFNACWYARQSPETIAFADRIAGKLQTASAPQAQTRGEVIADMTRAFVQTIAAKAATL